jgi:hypothetical protein
VVDELLVFFALQTDMDSLRFGVDFVDYFVDYFFNAFGYAPVFFFNVIACVLVRHINAPTLVIWVVDFKTSVDPGFVWAFFTIVKEREEECMANVEKRKGTLLDHIAETKKWFGSQLTVIGLDSMQNHPKTTL